LSNDGTTLFYFRREVYFPKAAGYEKKELSAGYQEGRGVREEGRKTHRKGLVMANLLVTETLKDAVGVPSSPGHLFSGCAFCGEARSVLFLWS